MITLTARQVLKRIESICSLSSLDQNKVILRKALVRRIKLVNQSLKRHNSELDEARRWPEAEKDAHLLQAHFNSLQHGKHTISLPDWENPEETRVIILNPEMQPSEEISHRFRKIKKFKKGIPHLERQITETARRLKDLEVLLHELEKIQTSEELDTIRQSAGLPDKQRKPDKQSKHLQPKQKPYFEFFSEKGISIWVGRNAKGNDSLTFHYANGLDTWLHVAGFPGSHVVVHTLKGEPPDADTLVDAMQLAFHFSKAQNRGEAEICISLRKHVSRMGQNQPGKVQVAQQKIVKVRADPERLKRLKLSRE